MMKKKSQNSDLPKNSTTVNPNERKGLTSTKSRRKRMPMPTDIQDFLFSEETVSLLEKAQESFAIGENRQVKQLSGKYERYYFDENKQLIYKDLLNIHTDGRVVLRSHQGIFKGIAFVSMNTTLSINLLSLNDEDTFCSQLLCYVGRNGYDDIVCLKVLCTSIDCNNLPIARQEVLIPADTFGVLPEVIKLESQAFYKLNYKYPQLSKLLQSRQLHTNGSITWN